MYFYQITAEYPYHLREQHCINQGHGECNDKKGQMLVLKFNLAENQYIRRYRAKEGGCENKSNWCRSKVGKVEHER